MSKKRKNQPKDMEELMDIYYGGDFDKKRRYIDSFNTGTMAPHLEKEILKFINPNLSPERIPEERSTKTFDYVIESEKILLEVTSINVPVSTSERIDPYIDIPKIDIPKKLNEKILHIEEKEKQGYDDFTCGGVIFVDIFLLTLLDVMQTEKLIENIAKSNFKTSRVDFLVFLPQPASISGISSYELYPPVLLSKEIMRESSMRKAFPNMRIIVDSEEINRGSLPKREYEKSLILELLEPSEDTIRFQSKKGIPRVDIVFDKNDSSKKIRVIQMAEIGILSKECRIELLSRATEKMQEKYPEYSFDLEFLF